VIKIPDNEICEICIMCNKPKDSNKQTYYCGKDSKVVYYYHAFCLEKLKLLLKIRKSNVLNSVDFKSLEIILGILIDEIPNEIVSSLNQCRTEIQPKFEITLALDKKKHNFFSKGWYEEIENLCELCTENPEENRFCPDCEYYPSNIIKRIHFLLGNDSKTVEEIAIISKAFNLTSRDFLKYIIDKEIDYIKFLLELDNPKAELKEYYKFEINIDALKKLILVEAI